MRFKYYRGTVEIIILIGTAILNSYWVDLVLAEPASIYVIGMVQTVTTVVVLTISHFLYARKRRATMRTGNTTGGNDGT